MLLIAEEVPEVCDYVVDGTLFPCWSQRNHRELWSGKRGTTGMNARILVRPDGRFVWAPGALSGRLFSGRLVAFPGSDIMMARSHEVQWFTKTNIHDLMRNGPSS